jgi:hypothetical protein
VQEQQQQQQQQRHPLHEKGTVENSKDSSESDEELRGKKSFQCRQCKRYYNGRRSLYLHQKLQHGGGEEMQDSPYNEDKAPWLDPVSHSVVDLRLKEVYDANREHILKKNASGEDSRHNLMCTYNFPTNDLQEAAEEELYDFSKHIFNKI